MAFKVRWLTDEKQVLYLYFEDGGMENWREYHRTLDQTWQLAAEVDYDIIAIVAGYDIPMPSGSPIPHLQRSMQSTPANILLSINIVERSFEKMVVELVAKLQRNRRHYIVTSWAAANKILESKNLPIIPDEDIPPRLH